MDERRSLRGVICVALITVIVLGSSSMFQIAVAGASSIVPYEDIGIEWNQNPSLIKTDGCWDSRIWDWNWYSSELFRGDANNYIHWSEDGLVESNSMDNGLLPLWQCAEFNQGNARYENEVYNLAEYGMDKKISSLAVDGSVTFFEGIGYTGQNITFTSDVSYLLPWGWNNRASSLKLTQGSRVILYELADYKGWPARTLRLENPSYQPPELKVSDKSSIILEGVVQNLHTSTWTGPGWTGVKFDVFAVENHSSTTGKNLMLEMYILRDGANLDWSSYCILPNCWGSKIEGLRGPSVLQSGYNYLMALDAFPRIVNRTTYSGNLEKWTIDVKAFIQRACNHWPELDISELSVVKIGFTIEAAYQLPALVLNPGAGCSLTRLRLAYTQAPAIPAYVYIDPINIRSTSLTRGSIFNATVRADIPTSPGVVGIEFKLTWNASLLNATNMEEVIFHETMPPDEVNANLWKIKHVISSGYASYCYTYQDIGRAISGGYAPIIGSHVVAILTFEVEDNGTCELHLDQANLGDRAANAVPTVILDGSFSNVPRSPELAVYVAPSQANDSLGPGSTFTIEVKADSIASHSGIMGVQFELDWDPNLLELENATEVLFHEVTPQDSWGNIWKVLDTVNNTGGYYAYAYTWQDSSQAITDGYAPIYGNCTLALLTFKVRAIGECPFRLAICKVGNNYANPLTCILSDGTFNNIIAGDINRDGIVNIYDAIMFVPSFGSVPDSPQWNLDADLNHDNLIDIYDVILLAGRFGQHYP